MADLARVLLTEKLRSLLEQRRSGVLVVTQGDVSKGVFLKAGNVVFASSTLESDRLGENLVKLGRISRAEFMAAVRAATGPKKKRVGETLVDAGLLSEEELGHMVAMQVQKIVLSLFKWEEGTTRFFSSDDPLPQEMFVDLSTHRLLLEGARLFPDVARLEGALGPADRRLRVAPRPPFDYGRMPFTPAEKTVLADASKKMKLAQILERTTPRRPLLVRALYALMAGGILEDAERQDTDVYEVDTGTFRIALGGPAEKPAADARVRLLQAAEVLPRATHYEVLGVPSTAGQNEIQAAYLRLIDEDEREWKPFQNDPQLASLISTLRLRRRQAFHVLSDQARRTAYDSTLSGVRRAARGSAITAEALSNASRLAREARVLLQRGDREGAVALLLESVRMDPGDRPTRRTLALALAEHPTLFRSAERHFLAALDLEPTDHELRYELAAYYSRAGLPKRALAQLRALLADLPDHEQARQLVREIESTEQTKPG